MTGEPPPAMSRLALLADRLAHPFQTFRSQIDKTGLFPDLTGPAGRSLRKSVRDEGALTKSYMLMCGLSGGIAALGLLQSSTAVVIGAMLISPMMGPIASMGFAFASFDGRQIRDAAQVVAIGAAIGIVTGMLLTWISPIHNATPEIIARTQPTLLDLAVAVFSGIAGAYATVLQKGATAIGVAIATALMPPLATVGYGIGVGNIGFALGAFLLFITNLAAIAFSFALVARLSGAARPMTNVEITPRLVIVAVAAFAALATPLAVTLYQVTAEIRAQALVRRVLTQELQLRPVNIAQLEVKWPLRGEPSVDAVVVSPHYVKGAEARVLARLEAQWGRTPSVNLQQVVAADVQSQTAAIVNAAVERSTAGIARDVPPLAAIRLAIGLPVQALWVNRSERSVQIVPIAAEGWSLGDYRQTETAAAAAGDGWQVRIVPPVTQTLFVDIPSANGAPVATPALADAIWAIDRWGVQGISVAGMAARNTDEDRARALALAQFMVAQLQAAGIKATATLAAARRVGPRDPVPAEGVTVQVVKPPPPREPAPAQILP